MCLSVDEQCVVTRLEEEVSKFQNINVHAPLETSQTTFIKNACIFRFEADGIPYSLRDFYVQRGYIGDTIRGIMGKNIEFIIY